MSIATHSPVTGHRLSTAVPEADAKGFLVSRRFDLLFVANVLWPLVFAIDVWGTSDTHYRLLFWQIYFITTPHRWITLLLVLGDGKKTAGRRLRFLAWGAGLAAVCLSVRFGTGSLLCLGAIDYLWNAWHFAAQHHGIYRIYQKRSDTLQQPNSSGVRPHAANSVIVLERWLFRGFILYVISRVAGLGWTIDVGSWSVVLEKIDVLVLLIPAGLVLRALTCLQTAAAKTYLFSVLTLFSSLLLAAHFQITALVLKLSLASAIFHAVEYLAIVSWSTQSAKNQTRSDVFGHLSRRWLLYLALFIAVIGAGNYLLSTQLRDLWILLNIVVAFWHYCFDGMIWKAPPPSISSTKMSP